MKRNYFFIKKFIFSIIFLATLMIFCVGDLIAYFPVYRERGKKLKEVSSVAELKGWIQKTDSEISSNVLGKMKFIELYGYIQKLLGKREFNNFAYVKDDDGMMYYGSVAELETDDLEEYAGNVMRLNEYIESRGAHLLVVIPPTKVLYGAANLNKKWTINDPNKRTDRFMSMLQQRGVDALDLRHYMENTGLSLEEMFFKTDHHWTPLAAFYGMNRIVERMNELYDLNLDPTGYYRDLSNYSSYTYKSSFLGSTGENSGAVYSGVDDYTFYWPRCDKEFEWHDYEHDERTKGRLEDSLLYSNRLITAEDIYDNSMGSVYIREIVDSERIVNNSDPDAPVLTVLRDSYFSPIAVFMAPMFSKIDMMWTRNASGINMEEYIKNEYYNYVILEVYPYNLDAQSFDFFHEDKQDKINE
ncbi:MAG: hypothetical protein K6E53_11835 [Lachnospiraceae bacterium]|nr:hypothetical protein [Lachnospiraceae bacterium]